MKLKKLCLFFLAAILTATVFGCGKDDENAKKQISFDSKGGSAIEIMEANAQDPIRAPQNPTKLGYEFLGWYTDSNYSNKFQFSRMPNQNITLYAKWSLNTYTITYYLNGGLGENPQNNLNNPDTFNVSQNNIYLQAPTNGEKFFAGWYSDESLTKKVTFVDTLIATDIELFAKWSDVEVTLDYNIIYHLDGGTNNASNPLTFNKDDNDITLANPTKTGFTFVGWYSDEALTGSITTIDTETENDVHVYAKWQALVVEDVYLISYELNGGINGSNPVRYTESTPNITLANPIKVGCTFKGWYTDSEFTNEITTIDTSTKQNYTLYAKWYDFITDNEYRFDFGIGKEYVLYHVSDTHVDLDPTREEELLGAHRRGYAEAFNEKYDANYLFNSTTLEFKEIVKYVNLQNPDAVCYSGDIMNAFTTANYEFINTEIQKTNAPYVYAMGNHENPSSAYEDMAGVDTTAFTLIEFDDFEIVCLDNSDMYYTEDQYDKLLVEVAKNKPIVLVEHVPLLNDYNCETILESRGDYFFIDYYSCDATTKKVMNLIFTNDNIKIVLCGHIHGKTLTYLTADGKPQLTSSSGLIGYINRIVIY